MNATKQIIFWFCIIVGLTGIAISQELPEHPQPQHQPLICQFPANVANCVYYNNPADSIPAPQSNPPYIYPVTHAKTHARRNMIISGALSAATMSAVIILTHHDSPDHADAIIHKPVILGPRREMDWGDMFFAFCFGIYAGLMIFMGLDELGWFINRRKPKRDSKGRSIK